MKKRRSIWFFLFWLLIIAILAGGAYTAYLVMVPTRTNFVSQPKQSETTVDLSLNRDQLNALAKTYLTEQSNGQFDFKVNDDNVTASGTVKIYGQKLDTKLTMQPKVAEGGNVIMDVQKVELGKLDLPVDVAMGYVKQMYSGPKGVQIQPDQKQIALDLTQLTKKNSWSVRADELNLKDNKFNFTGVMKNAQ
ncbi:YpmS family protein [Fructobacillus sp. M2-14]|uniref:YpmS family protein n=1 Tax=Fructobacillus broussonetiae TaxID=2713173 RepID=A0ABS5QZ47_9LACO|nr:YpmS family protein [Fructobacillus broussonetiae]MBS9338227.1 YpmS family protein [Fructobacillus broussonetiae]